MPAVIFSIHGLANKPLGDVLLQGSLDAICEGLRRNHGNENPAIDLRGVYWADLCYPACLDSHPEPYVPAEGTGPLPRYKDGWYTEVIAKIIGVGGLTVDAAKRVIGMDPLADAALERKVQDLS